MSETNVVGDIEEPVLDESAESSAAEEGQTQQESEVVESSEAQEPKRNRVQERINQLAREKREERQKREELENRLKELEQLKASTPEVSNTSAPKEGDFEDYTEFERAKEQHLLDRASDNAYQRLSQENKKREEQAQAALETERLSKLQATFDANVNSRSSNFENLADVVYGEELGSFLDQDLAVQIAEMDKGVEVAYHLGTHLDEADRISRMTPIQRARELAKLEMTVATPQAKKVSGAPEPITPVDGGAMPDEWGKIAASATFE